MKLRSIVFCTTLIFTNILHAADGLVTIKSPHSPSVTIDKLETLLKSKGMTVFLRVDHAAGAEKVGAKLRPTQLLVFGNPKVGTPLMQCAQTSAIDLPQKMLAWEDEQRQTWLAYNDPAYLSERHGLAQCTAVLEKVAAALSNFAKGATLP